MVPGHGARPPSTSRSPVISASPEATVKVHRSRADAEDENLFAAGAEPDGGQAPAHTRGADSVLIGCRSRPWPLCGVRSSGRRGTRKVHSRSSAFSWSALRHRPDCVRYGRAPTSPHSKLLSTTSDGLSRWTRPPQPLRLGLARKANQLLCLTFVQWCEAFRQTTSLGVRAIASGGLITTRRSL